MLELLRSLSVGEDDTDSAVTDVLVLQNRHGHAVSLPRRRERTGRVPAGLEAGSLLGDVVLGD